MIEKKRKKSVYDEVAEAVTRSQDILAEATDKLNDAKAKRDEIEAKANVALIAEDDASYKAARSRQREIEDDIELLTHKIANIKSGNLFNEAAQVELLKRVDETANEFFSDAMPRLVDLLDEACGLMEEIQQEFVRKAEARDRIQNKKSLSNHVTLMEINPMIRAMRDIKSSSFWKAYK